MNFCECCNGTGIIITCWDDLCVGGHHCIHGDGEEICPECHGDGEVSDFDDEMDGQAAIDCNVTVAPANDAAVSALTAPRRRATTKAIRLSPETFQRLYSQKTASGQTWDAYLESLLVGVYNQAQEVAP